MATGSGKQHLVFGDFVDQQPVRFDMQVPLRFPVTDERVRFTAGLEHFSYQLSTTQYKQATNVYVLL